MDISGVDFASTGLLETNRTALNRPNDFGQIVARSIDEQQAEKEEADKQQQVSGGLPFPGQVSREEQQRIENLKNQAMQIAAQSEGGLTPGEKAQIKAIEQEISDMGGMPMSENLMEKAKGVADEKQVESGAEAKEAEVARNIAELEKSSSEEDSAMGLGGETVGSQPGLGMLNQRALVTAIKGLSSKGAGGLA